MPYRLEWQRFSQGCLPLIGDSLGGTMHWYCILGFVALAVGIPALICELTDRALARDS